MADEKTTHQTAHQPAHRDTAENLPGINPDDEIMKIRKQAGSIGEVIEPVTRTSKERTN